MSAADHVGENQALFDAVHAVGMALCPQLGIAIPVGKDSMSMRTAWQAENDKGESEEKSVTAPLSLVVTGFAPVTDALKTLTPQINLEQDESDLILIDLGVARTVWAARRWRRSTASSATSAPTSTIPRISRHSSP